MSEQLELFDSKEKKEDTKEDMSASLEAKKSILDELTEEQINDLFKKEPDDFRKGQL